MSSDAQKVAFATAHNLDRYTFHVVAPNGRSTCFVKRTWATAGTPAADVAATLHAAGCTLVLASIWHASCGGGIFIPAAVA